ncbi:hypothetical protein FB45DRAFT_858921 [Roridomyces roridus]|uniref:RNB domain-containing protein n=1 Tax=Roridomyces roridus TaxID=1738132 RepID=A0AAD7CIJ1_9AGAR|nr:hypothetical protein FB45DRAFT_858921 [Roridomyces roridus]
MPSLEKTSFDAGMVESEEEPAEGSFIPGTFVEIRRNEVATHGVVVGEKIKNMRAHISALTTGGELWDPLRDDIMFAVPALVAPDVALRCSVDEIALDNTQLTARVQVMQSIRHLERDMEDAMSDIMSREFDVYSRVRSQDPDKWATTTVAEVARMLSDKPNLNTMFAAHKYLMERPEYFLADISYIRSQSFDVRPLSHVQTVTKVTEWSRQDSGPLQDFARRAIPVIAANRQRHAETRNDLAAQSPGKHVWTEDDLTILNFLHQSLQPWRSIQKDPYSIGRSAIVRHLEPSVVVNDSRVHSTVIDLGIYAPWQDISSLRRVLNLDLDPPETSPKVQATNALVQRSLSTPPARGAPLGPEDFYPSDPLETMRHDFGDMPIYVIDDAGAHELDDGISYEAIPEEPGSYWLHAHVADPASLIPPTHILAQRAAQQAETTYLVHRSWPLFPSTLMFAGRPGMSLAQRTERATENRVLTFSSKINADGELVDSLVRPGIARNFVKLSYDEVDLVLTGELMPRMYPFGNPATPPPKPQLSDSQINDLRTLDRIRDTLLRNRFKKGIFESDNAQAKIVNYRMPKGILSPNLSANTTDYSGFPQYDYWVETSSAQHASSRGLVAEVMKTASRTSSRWCAERGIPVIRRVASQMVASPEALERLLAKRNEHGFVSNTDMLAAASLQAMAGYSLTPGAHWAIGASEGEGYARSTSPLRRFSDLIAHYQIHRALLGQKPHFSTEYLQEYIHKLNVRDTLRKRTEKAHLRTLAFTAIKRWMEAPSTDMPDPLLDLVATQVYPPRFNVLTGAAQADVPVPALGITVLMTELSRKSMENWRVGESVKVRIKEIRMGVQPAMEVVAR